MTPSPSIPANPLTEAQVAEILSQLQQLVRLINPLMALLSGASGLSGGAGERLAALIQQLTGVSTGLHQAVEELTKVFGPEGTLSRMDQRLAGMEAAMTQIMAQQREETQFLRNLAAWMAGTA